MKSRETAEVSFVIPAYNEANVIAISLERLARILELARLRYELIIVDDGSTDNTRKKVEEFGKRNQLKLISLGRNMGKGHALKTGFAHSCGKKVVFFDADLDIQAECLPCYVSALDSFDVVVASKRHPGSHCTVPISRRLVSHWFNISVKLLTGLRLGDTQTGLKAVRKDSLRQSFLKLTTDRYALDVELLITAHVMRLRIVELPVTVTVTNSIDVRKIWTTFLDLLCIAYRLRVMRYYDRFVQPRQASKGTRSAAPGSSIY